jgi:diacylglycerol kinase (ATP)
MVTGIIINPIAGSGRSMSVSARVNLANDVLEKCRVKGQVMVTERCGHGREIAASLVAKGAETLVVWGGDGSVNEIASEIAFHGPVLGIVPSGSGNGLAHELQLEWNPARALETALRGSPRWIDAGELGGRLFFNVAGVGVDANIAAVFNTQIRRGKMAYFVAACRELVKYKPQRYTIRTSGVEINDHALIIALANTRQYGNNAMIAPLAHFDDGLLELVVIPTLSPLSMLWQARRLFAGSVHRMVGVRTHSIQEVEISGEQPLGFHVDGEFVSGSDILRAKVHAKALQVRVPW